MVVFHFTIVTYFEKYASICCSFFRFATKEGLLCLFFQYVKELKIVENNGFEPLTPCVQGRCSSQLS